MVTRQNHYVSMYHTYFTLGIQQRSEVIPFDKNVQLIIGVWVMMIELVLQTMTSE